MPSYAPPAPPPGMPVEELRRFFLNQDPTAGFYAYLQERGGNLAGGSDPMARFAQGRMGNYLSNYYAEAANNPNLGFYDYLQQRQFSPQDEYQAQSPEARGDYSSRLITPRARWVAG